MKAHYTRSRGGLGEDVAVTTHDFFFTVTPVTNAHCDTIAAAFVTFWDAACLASTGVVADSTRLAELRFYKGYDGDGSPGEVDYVKSYTGKVGQLPGMAPPQCSTSITERTDFRKHWGRFYLPSIGVGALNVDGTLVLSKKGTLANNAQTMYNNWGALSGCTPIVWGRKKASMSYLAIAPPRWRPSWMEPADDTVELNDPVPLAVQAVQVDEIVDIIRRRRWDTVTSRTTLQLA